MVSLSANTLVPRAAADFEYHAERNTLTNTPMAMASAANTRKCLIIVVMRKEVGIALPTIIMTAVILIRVGWPWIWGRLRYARYSTRGRAFVPAKKPEKSK